MQLIAALSNFVGAVVLALSLFTTSSDGADEGEMLAVWDNLFPCRAGEQGGIPLSNQCDGEADCEETITTTYGDQSLKVSIDEHNCPPSSSLLCPGEPGVFERVGGANEKMCYHLRPVEMGVGSFFDAMDYCEGVFNVSVGPEKVYMARPNSKDQVETLALWAKSKGVPKDINGVWLGYIKQVLVLQAEQNNNVPEERIHLRRTGFGYFGDYVTSLPIAEDIWRRGQPNDQPLLEETCVAKKKLHARSARMRGVDTFRCECTGCPMHYILCETAALTNI